MIVRNVYEGTIPDKVFNISVFLTEEVVSMDKRFFQKEWKTNFEK